MNWIRPLFSVVAFTSLLIWIAGCGPIDMKVDRHVTTYFEDSDSLGSPDFHTGMEWWRTLDSLYRRLSIVEYGVTDAGYPLYAVVLSNGPKDRHDLRLRNKPLLLINNAIHPGEPDGVDASMMMFRDILETDSLRSALKDMIIVCIPYYNIGGALNRNSHSRANQDGPKEYGFRGNAQNLDLNRDFIKMDSKNAQTFAGMIGELDPDLYVETHVSNGADYPYTMTYLSTLTCKTDTGLECQMVASCTPFLKDYYLTHTGQEMIPYVNVHGHSPEHGYAAFYDSPRYSSGYLSLLGIPGYITETHMLKPFPRRVMATYHFLMGAMKYVDLNGKQLKKSKRDSKKDIAAAKEFGFNYKIDSTYADSLLFTGYAARYKPSEVSGQPRLYYDRDSVYTRMIPLYTRYLPQLEIAKPEAYILKKGYTAVEDRLDLNGVKHTVFDKDTQIMVTYYHIDNFETNTRPYEKHYFHYNTEVTADSAVLKVRKGDWLIPMGTSKDKFIMSVLEPETEDSYFNWNFYDAILQQKEWYSAYVFEDKAAEYLQQDSVLRHQFEQKKAEDEQFREHPDYQLFWIYQHSPHYESVHMRLPVYRVE